MSYLVAISGAQSCGKSTIIESLKKTHNINDKQTARFVMKNMGLTLEEILQDESTTISFQEQILLAKRVVDAYEKGCHQPDDLVFTERSLADLVAFAETWKDRFSPHYSEWLEDYRLRCHHHQEIYEVVVFLPSGVFAHIDDGIRAKSDTQNIVSEQILNFLSKHHPERTIIIHEDSVEDRLREIHEKISFFLKTTI